jgi:hypothetical protein
MKLSARTAQILRNFATINQSIIFKPGNELKTISSSRSIMAMANTDIENTQQFAIYDLPQFLSAISLFEDAELTPSNENVIIGGGSEKIRYACAEPSLIQCPPEKQITLPSIDVEFELRNEVLARLQKALGVINAPEIAITGDGSKIFLEALSTKDSSRSTYRVEVGTTTNTFKLIFLAENVKLLSGDYTVSISRKGLAHFKSSDVQYWIAVESSSTFD